MPRFCKKVTPIKILPSKEYHLKYDLSEKNLDYSGHFTLNFRPKLKIPESYLDLTDKVRKNFADKKNSIETNKCTRGFLTTKCKCGNYIAKIVLCGLEWCPDCGRKYSHIHCRRINRWYDKAMNIKKLGMFTVTIPPEVRQFFHRERCDCNTKENRERIKNKESYIDVFCEKCHYTGFKMSLLREYRQYIKDYVRKNFEMKRGLSRYHWSGDCKHCKGEGCKRCNFTGSKNKWYPHLHILHDVGYIDIKEIKKFQELARRWLQRKTGVVLRYPVTMHNEYRTTEGQKFHLLSYVTRATWRDANNYEVINTIKGFRTTSAWGKWPKPEHPRQSEIALLMKNECSVCKAPLNWKPLKTKKEFFSQGLILTREIEGGFYEVLDLTDISDKMINLVESNLESYSNNLNNRSP